MVANRNLTDQEWRSYFGEVPYKKTCPDLPTHPSVIERALGEADALHQKGDRAGAARIFASAVQWVVEGDNAIMNNQICRNNSLEGYAESLFKIFSCPWKGKQHIGL
jgi:hypothetical protein